MHNLFLTFLHSKMCVRTMLGSIVREMLRVGNILTIPVYINRANQYNVIIIIYNLCRISVSFGPYILILLITHS